MKPGPENEAPEARDLSRREMLGLVGSAATAGLLVGCGPGQSGSQATTSASTTGATNLEGTTAAETTGTAAKKTDPSCVLAPETTEGPYYPDGDKVRKDITESKRGVPLRLRTTVVDATECTPIEDAAVDIWHCNAGGNYSGFTQQASPRGKQGAAHRQGAHRPKTRHLEAAGSPRKAT